MAEGNGAQRAQWSGRLGFILAASGSAVGLGNIWKFPYMAGVNGGGAFVLVYLICIALIGIPILIGEIQIGKKSQKNAVQSFEVLHKPKSPYRFAGFLGLASAFLILSFYSVVGGWVLDFELQALLNNFQGMTDEEVKGFLGGLFESPVRLVVWHTIFMALTIGIVIGGIAHGIERAARVLMPLLFVLLIVLLIRSFFLPGFGKAMGFLFQPDFAALGWSGVLEAVGQSFFTLSLGMGAMITYGSYLKEEESTVSTAWTVGILDTAMAVTAGVIIFAVVFTFEQEPGAGPELMFVTLPLLFRELTGGYFVSVAFFLLVAFAALTSAISLLEVVVAYWDEAHGWARRKTTVVMGVIIWAMGILCALSFNILADFKIGGKFTVFDLFDFLTSRVFMPFGGMVIAIYFGWVLGPRAVEQTFLGEKYKGLATGLLWTLRVVAPIGVAVMLIQGLWDTFS